MAGKGDKFRPTKLTEYRDNFDSIEWRKRGTYCYNCGLLLDSENMKNKPENYIFYEDSNVSHKQCNFN